MHFYYYYDENGNIVLIENTVSLTADHLIEISQEEYEAKIAKQLEDYIASLPVEEPSDEISPEEFMSLLEEAL